MDIFYTLIGAGYEVSVSPGGPNRQYAFRACVTRRVSEHECRHWYGNGDSPMDALAWCLAFMVAYPGKDNL